MKFKSFNERNRILFSWFFVISLVIILTISQTAWEMEPMVEESLMLIASILIGIGAVGRIWCAVYISGRKDSVLVKTGPYSLCRNPLYFFSLLGGIGVGLATETFTIPLLILLAFVLYYPAIILAEERRLADIFGEEYKIYQKGTPSFFPKWNLFGFNEPDTYSINPQKIRRACLDVLWFIWLIGIIEFVSACHEAKILPTLIFLL